MPAPPAASAQRGSYPYADAHVYPDGDGAVPKSERKVFATAVLLFAPPAQLREGDGITHVEVLRLQPVLCVVGGKLTTGVRCGEAMPARAKVRLTGAEVATVVRSHGRLHYWADGVDQSLPPPYAPACCNYKSCSGKTVPYFLETTDIDAVVATKTILAVWPADAEIGLLPIQSSMEDADVPAWTRRSRPGERNYPIATSDLDGDGHRELLLYEKHVHNYGLYVLLGTRETEAPLYSFDCGDG